MGPFLQNVIELFSKKKIEKTNLDASVRHKAYVVITQDSIPKKGLVNTGIYRPKKELLLVDVYNFLGNYYTKTEIDSVVFSAPTKCDPIDPDCFHISGSKQYYTVTIDDADAKTIDLLSPLPAGTYIIIVHYNHVSANLGIVSNAHWPAATIPSWTNTDGSKDIITIVSDGTINRAVASLGYIS